MAVTAAIARLVLGLDSVPLGYPDTSSYQALARDIAWLDFTDYTGWRTPVYSILLLAGGLNWSAIRFIQSLLGIAVAAMLLRIVYRSTRSAALALAAGLAYGLSLRPLVYESTILSETLCTFLLMLSVLAFARMLFEGRFGTGDHALLGAIVALTGFTRVMYVFLAPLYCGLLAVLKREFAAERAERGRRLAIFAAPAAVLLVGWCVFNQLTLGYFGLTTQIGFSLSNHSGAFVELAPARYAAIRDAYLEARAVQVARTGSHADTIFFWKAPRGYTDLQLTRELTRMSLGLFASHPLLYARDVGRAWLLFWTGVPAQRPYNFRGGALASWIWATWHVEQHLLVAVNLLFLIFASLSMLQFVRGRCPATFDLCVIAIVLAASIVQAIIEFGENDRYYSPTYPLVLYVVIVSAWRYMPAWIGAQSRRFLRASSDIPAIAVLSVSALALICIPVAYHHAEASAVEQATKVANSWLTLVDEGQNREAWSQLNAVAKRRFSPESWARGIGNLRKLLGPVTSRQVVSVVCDTNPPMEFPGKYVVIEYRTAFQNKKSAVEIVAPRLDSDGRWRPASYYVADAGEYHYGGTCKCWTPEAETRFRANARRAE